MEKFIPREKLSKKAQRELNNKMRKTWGTLNPVTRTPANPKAYNRKKLRKNEDSFPELFWCGVYFIRTKLVFILYKSRLICLFLCLLLILFSQI
jgi:hypothetical protein